MSKTRTEWVTTRQVCEHLSISRATLYRWIDDGLPVHRARQLRFDLEEVDAWLRNRCSDPVADGSVA